MHLFIELLTLVFFLATMAMRFGCGGGAAPGVGRTALLLGSLTVLALFHVIALQGFKDLLGW